jgi:hypothetical protein
MYGTSVTNTLLKINICFTELFLYSELPEMLMGYKSNYKYPNHGEDADSSSIIVMFIRMEPFC